MVQNTHFLNTSKSPDALWCLPCLLVVALPSGCDSKVVYKLVYKIVAHGLVRCQDLFSIILSDVIIESFRGVLMLICVCTCLIVSNNAHYLTYQTEGKQRANRQDAIVFTIPLTVYDSIRDSHTQIQFQGGQTDLRVQTENPEPKHRFPHRNEPISRLTGASRGYGGTCAARSDQPADPTTSNSLYKTEIFMKKNEIHPNY